MTAAAFPTNRIRHTIALRTAVRAAAVAALAAGGLTLAGAPVAHALPSTAKLTVAAEGYWPDVNITGQFGTQTLAEAKQLAASTTTHIEMWGDDSVTDDYLSSMPAYKVWSTDDPKSSAVPFSAAEEACGSLLNLDEDNYPGNRLDEVYARILVKNSQGKVIRSLKTNNVSIHDYHPVFGKPCYGGV